MSIREFFHRYNENYTHFIYLWEDKDMTMLFIAIVAFLIYSDVEMNKRVEA